MHVIVTHVDSITKLAADVEPLANGPSMPDIEGFRLIWWNQSEWPTDMPLFYGTYEEDADLAISGVIGVISEEDSFAKRESERELQSYNARNERNARMFLAQNQLNKALREERMGLPHKDIGVIDTYMQSLADIPEQDGFPFDIVWPTLD